MHNICTITANIEGGVVSKKSSETFKQNPWKIAKKKFIFSEVAGSENELIHVFFKVLL